MIDRAMRDIVDPGVDNVPSTFYDMGGYTRRPSNADAEQRSEEVGGG
jgi:hypothetical protein